MEKNEVVYTQYYVATICFDSTREKCEPYYKKKSPSVCDTYLTELDYVYIGRPYGQPFMREFLEELNSTFPFVSECHDLAARAICTYYYLPCGYNGTIHVPQFLCPDVCEYVAKQCYRGWKVFQRLVSSFESDEHDYNSYMVEMLLCNRTDKVVQDFNLTNDCCTNGGIILPTEGTTK